jgi:Protein of unknown function (DUF3179)
MPIRFNSFAITLIAAVVAVCSLALSPVIAEPTRWKLEGWKTDFSKSSIKFGEILSGGPPKDGIPSIDKPKFRPISDISDIADTEPVITLGINGETRAYPLRILIWHEIVNDQIGDVPVTVTYCPLCNSAIAFDRRVDGRVLDFGTTGKLRNSDLVMYDRATESWWQQFTGEVIVGSLLGKSLKMLPSRLESYANFKARHPDGKVLVPNNPGFRPYGANPYFGYDRSAKPFLYNGAMPAGINPMARVVAVRTPSATFAVSLSLLRKIGPITQSGVTLTWQPGQNSAIDTRKIAEGRDVGTVSAATTGSDGKPAPIPYDVTFAFVFHAFHPKITIRTE